ncbi:hypothetical protein Pan189_19840 [Stratiformator vulcanicus]|uniref:Uncharacterized protein n=2 Tax=Stratiformator vulcanicus TaxID=2527980 RepID=A0A517R199_9PLAN|nr:hypothetical protein Pan189_19840 [Stratiformator vulcanicus]
MITAVNGHQIPAGYLGGFAFSGFLACVAALCLVEKGRWITGRVVAAGIALGAAAAVFGDLTSAEAKPMDNIGLYIFFVPVGLACAFFAITGNYPEEMPLSEVFARPRKKRKKKGKLTKKKRRTATRLPPPLD